MIVIEVDPFVDLLAFPAPMYLFFVLFAIALGLVLLLALAKRQGVYVGSILALFPDQ